MHAADELDVLATGGKRVERRSLHGESEPAAHVGRLRRDVEAGDPRRATGCRQKGRQDPDGRGLSGAVGAEETQELTRLDVEADAANGARAAGLTRDQVSGVADRAHRGLTSSQ